MKCTSYLTSQIPVDNDFLRRKSADIKYTMSDHSLIYIHIESKNTILPTADHITVKFGDMKNVSIFMASLILQKNVHVYWPSI